jgi:hypothetical protein
MSRERDPLPSTTVALVDTFTCAIAVMFVVLLSAQQSLQQVAHVPQTDVVVACTGAGRADPAFSRVIPAMEAGAAALSSDPADILAPLTQSSDIALRVTFDVGAEDRMCIERIFDVVDALNREIDGAQVGSSTGRPYFLADVRFIPTPVQPDAPPRR